MKAGGGRDEGDVCACAEDVCDAAGGDVAASDDENVFVLELPGYEQGPFGFGGEWRGHGGR